MNYSHKVPNQPDPKKYDTLYNTWVAWAALKKR